MSEQYRVSREVLAAIYHAGYDAGLHKNEDAAHARIEGVLHAERVAQAIRRREVQHTERASVSAHDSAELELLHITMAGFGPALGAVVTRVSDDVRGCPYRLHWPHMVAHLPPAKDHGIGFMFG